jgi:uncharacterized membrane protein YqjE
MADANHQPPGLITLVRRLVRTGVGAFQNRLELFAVEWQQERIRLADVMLLAVAVVFLGILAILLITLTLILLFPPKLRIYATAGFGVLYLIAAIVAFFGLRAQLRRAPFADTIDQAKKDRAWLESLK